jgi:DNA-binding HxlR family transcriptional regulator
MLTQTLRSLEQDGIVSRAVTPTVPVRVDYELTDLGRSLRELLLEMRAWADQNMPKVNDARALYATAQA